MSDNSIILSFVLPCYNVELYLEDCLSSIYSCGLEESEYEVLCVDDCSPDGSITILRRYEKLHSNLRIISHNENKGLGAARNTGIREAQGDYLWFVDSDDFIGGNVSKAVEKAKSENLDILCFNYCNVDVTGKKISDCFVFTDSFAQTGPSFIDSVFGEAIVSHIGYVVRFLYRTKFLRSISGFPENCYWEDTVYMPRALFDASRVASISDILYFYRQNPSSICNSFSRAYSARMIYDYSFITGRDLLAFSECISSEKYSKTFRDTAIRKYLNAFPLFLARTNHAERKSFYSLIKTNRLRIKEQKKDISFVNRILLSPMGLFLSDIMSDLYLLKKRVFK